MRRAQTLVFAYGTLRPGCGNDRMLGDYLHVDDAVLDGYTLRYHISGCYPVIVPDENGAVVGSILRVNDGHLADAISMEVLAGYDARWLRVLPLVDDADLEVLTFTWSQNYYGPIIESGDWLTTPHAR